MKEEAHTVDGDSVCILQGCDDRQHFCWGRMPDSAPAAVPLMKEKAHAVDGDAVYFARL